MAFAFTLGAVRFARGLGCRGAALPATVPVLVAGGWMPHFAGYEKYGPLLVGLVFAASGLVRLAAGRGGEWELALGTLACAATHRTGLAVDRSVHLPGGDVARTFETRGEADALVRVAGTLNGLFFLAPLWPVGLAAWWFGRGGRRQPPAADERKRRIAPEKLPRVAQERRLSLVLELPIAMAIACQLARIQTQLDACPAWSATALSFAHDQIGVYRMSHAKPEAAARHFEQAFALAPNPRYAYQAGLAHYDAGHRDAAAAAFRTVIARNPHVADPWGGLARIAFDERDTLSAAALADSALRRNPNHAVAVGIRGEIVRARRGP